MPSSAMRHDSLAGRVYARFHGRSGFTAVDVSQGCHIDRLDANRAIQALIASQRFKRITSGLYRAVGAV
ncbi:MAG: hypothetical protein H0U59_05250 [Gemmatimonadaceae bacterium]|nr:hypothetical protein [Gemmatimonadaceae bacterium]